MNTQPILTNHISKERVDKVESKYHFRSKFDEPEVYVFEHLYLHF